MDKNLNIDNVLNTDKVRVEKYWHRAFNVLRRELGGKTNIEDVYNIHPDKLIKIHGIGKHLTISLIKFFIEYNPDYMNHHNIDTTYVIDMMLFRE